MADKKQKVIIIRKKKGGGGHGHHGGAWKVAYADFVTAMMAFFLVMWLMGSDEETKAAISHYFNHPNTPWQQGRDPASDTSFPMGENMGQGESILKGMEGQVQQDLIDRPPVDKAHGEEVKQYREISELMQEVLDGQLYGIDVNLEYLKFSVPETALFEPGSNKFNSGAPKYLDKIGQVLKGYAGYITVTGHTDNTGMMDQKYSNAYEFSLARAVSVMNYLVDKNWVSEDRLFPQGGGSRYLASSNETSEGRAKNRRIEFTLSRHKNL
jgi:chemotaxis protein MotB